MTRATPYNLIWILLAALLALTGLALADVHWLDRLIQSEQTQLYMGLERTTVVRGGDRQQVVARIVRAPGHRYRSEFLEPRGLAGQLLVCDGEQQSHFVPQRRLVLLSKGETGPYRWARPEIIKNRNLLLRNFEFVRGADGVLFGRPCVEITVKPKNYSYPVRTLWLETERLVELKRRVDLGHGSVIETSIEDLRFPAGAPQQLFQFVPPPGTALVWRPAPLNVDSLDRLEKLAQFKLLKPSPTPKGFQFESGSILNLPGTRVAWLRYTDGLGVISLFERPKGGSAGAFAPLPDGTGLPLAGATMYKSVIGQTEVLVAGDFSPELLKQVLASLK